MSDTYNMEGARLYLDLMKRTLTNLIYADSEVHICNGEDRFWTRWLVKLLAGRGIKLARPLPFDLKRRIEGEDWPPTAHTMIGVRRLDNIQECVEQVLAQSVPGDLVETGVWRGGGSIFMRAILEAHNITDRRVWVADSFEGLPPPNAEKYPADSGFRLDLCSELAVSLDDVKANFQRYDLLDDRVCFLKGWFRDTLPHAPIEKLAVLRCDGDLYESTMDSLVNLYPKVSRGGFVIIDDYNALSVCKKAVHDYREANGISDTIVPVDSSAVYWRRT